VRPSGQRAEQEHDEHDQEDESKRHNISFPNGGEERKRRPPPCAMGLPGVESLCFTARCYPRRRGGAMGCCPARGCWLLALEIPRDRPGTGVEPSPRGRAGSSSSLLGGVGDRPNMSVECPRRVIPHGLPPTIRPYWWRKKQKFPSPNGEGVLGNPSA
jgi:hypothetical protein